MVGPAGPEEVEVDLVRGAPESVLEPIFDEFAVFFSLFLSFAEGGDVGVGNLVAGLVMVLDRGVVMVEAVLICLSSFLPKDVFSNLLVRELGSLSLTELSLFLDLDVTPSSSLLLMLVSLSESGSSPSQTSTSMHLQPLFKTFL